MGSGDGRRRAAVLAPLHRIDAALLAVVLSTTTACSQSTSWVALGPDAVARLDGFRAGDEVAVRSVGGDEVTVTEDTIIRFSGRGVPERKVECRAIDLEATTLRCERRPGVTEEIDLTRTPTAHVLLGHVRAQSGPALAIVGLFAVAGLVAFALSHGPNRCDPDDNFCGP